MIKINDDLVILADGHCYAVGKPAYRNCGGIFLLKPSYYTTMEQALHGSLSIALRNGVADGTITTLRQFLVEQERLTAQLKELLDSVEV